MNYLPSLITLAVTVSLIIIVQLYFRIKTFQDNSNYDTDDEEGNNLSFIKHLLIIMVSLIGIGVSAAFIPKFKNFSTSIFAGSGIIAIIFGFASQQAFSNLIGGLFITTFKPFKKGDIIRFIDKDIIGKIEDITLRHTVINNFENKRIIVPNSIISSEIIENFHIIDKKVCNHFSLTISYESDVDKAIEIMKEEIIKHPEFIDHRNKKQKSKNDEILAIRLIDFTESGQQLKAWIWTKNPLSGYEMTWNLNYAIKKRFDQNGIKLSYPYTNVVLKKEEKSVNKFQEK